MGAAASQEKDEGAIVNQSDVNLNDVTIVNWCPKPAPWFPVVEAVDSITEADNGTRHMFHALITAIDFDMVGSTAGTLVGWGIGGNHFPGGETRFIGAHEEIDIPMARGRGIRLDNQGAMNRIGTDGSVYQIANLQLQADDGTRRQVTYARIEVPVGVGIGRRQIRHALVESLRSGSPVVVRPAVYQDRLSWAFSMGDILLFLWMGSHILRGVQDLRYNRPRYTDL
ncbi:hypothetical protein BDR26DRAFT_852808 [Obelidium mucronatum]|nr:hypothetical protein BDR26DRAFT_852808 [Obelidium mucronatum]